MFHFHISSVYIATYPYMRTYMTHIKIIIYVGIYVKPHIYAKIYDFFYMFHISLFRMGYNTRVCYWDRNNF
jgi:hypothetical protein